LTELRETFSPDSRPRIIGVTPELPKTEGRRQREMEVRLQHNGREQHDWMAIDNRRPLFDQPVEQVSFTNTLLALDENTTHELRPGSRKGLRENVQNPF
jgi:hypothetical protein